MRQSHIVTEFQSARAIAEHIINLRRWSVLIFLLGALSSQLSFPSWMPFLICAFAILWFFFFTWRAFSTFRCPVCNRIALNKGWWQDDANVFPTDPHFCPHCGEILK